MITLSLNTLHKSPATVTRLPTILLTQDQIDFYHREGYLAIPAITDAEDIATLRAIYDDMFERKVGYENGEFFDFAGSELEGKKESFPQMYMMSRYRPELRETQFWANAQAMAKQILGPEAKFCFEHALRKPPGGPMTPWHQDHAFYDKGTRNETFTIWIALQDVDTSNGCMEFIPKSHIGKLYPHHSMNDDPKIHAIEALGVDHEARVACPMPAGGATFHHRMTLHYTAPNVTDGPRRAYALMFGMPTDRILVPETHPWMAAKETARAKREEASLTRTRKLKRVVRRTLNRFGVFIE